ncbi:hypothetical protein ACSMXN_17415 [Jatrophihabitans sp. DSM 45814]
MALISVGLNNDYGHPSPLLIAELNKEGVPVHRTDTEGDLAIVDEHGALVTEVRAPSL